MAIVSCGQGIKYVHNNFRVEKDLIKICDLHLCGLIFV